MLSSAIVISVVAIDSISSPQNPPTVSQAAPEVWHNQVGLKTTLRASLEFRLGPARPLMRTDDSFPRHDTCFEDGNITFLVRKCSIVFKFTKPSARLQVHGTLLYCIHRYGFSRDLPLLYFSVKFTQKLGAPSYPWVTSNARILRLSSLPYIPSS